MLSCKVLALKTITELPPLKVPLAAAILDHPDNRQCHTDGIIKFHYGMYHVDDGKTAVTDDTPNSVTSMITSSVKSTYLLLGYPRPNQKALINPTMS
jgi:hypothetical protein